MAQVLDDFVDPKDIKNSEARYAAQFGTGRPVDSIVQFQYAWCLVRSHSQAHMKHGVKLLRELYDQAKDEQAQRDYLYYIAVADAKLKNYESALKLLDAILHVQPGNRQVIELRRETERRMRNDGLIGMAVVGGVAAAAIGGLVGLGLALSKGGRR